MYNTYLNYNGIYRGRSLGSISNTTEADTLINSLSLGNQWNVRLGDRITITDSRRSCEWFVVHIDRWRNSAANANPVNSITLMPRSYLPKISLSDNSSMERFNSTATTGVSQNENNPLYETTQGQEMSGYQAYYGSDVNQLVLANIRSELKAVLGNHLPNITLYLSCSIDFNTHSRVSNMDYGVADATTLMTTTAIHLPNEVEIFGYHVMGGLYDTGLNNMRFAAFNFSNPNHYGTSNFYLRDIASKSMVPNSTENGNFGFCRASDPRYIRPFMVIV